MPKIKDLAGDLPQQGYFPGHATAAATIEQVLFRAPCRGVITAVELTPNTTQAGANTNYFTVNVRNRGAAGAGTGVPAALAFTSGVDLTALTPKTLTLSGTSSVLAVAEGDVITAEKAVTGTGLACPAGAITVHFKAA